MNSDRRFLTRLLCLCLLAVFVAFAQDQGAPDAVLRKGIDAFAQGRSQEAVLALRSFLASTNLPSSDPRRLIATELLATALQNLGDVEAAVPLHVAVLSGANESGSDGAEWIALASNNLGRIRMEQGVWDEAASLLEKAVSLYRRVHGEDSRVTAVALENLGMLRLAQDDLRRAVPLLEESTRILRNKNPHNPVDLTTSLTGLGSAYTQLADYSTAMPLLQEAVATGALLGDRNPVLADALAELASLFLHEGIPDRAEPLLRKAIAIYQMAGERNRAGIAGVLTLFGLLRLHEGKYRVAAQYFRQALDLSKQVYGPDHVNAAAAEMNLAMACLQLGQYRESAELLRHSFRIEKGELGESRSLARWLDLQAQWEQKLGRPKEADAHFRESIAMFEKTAGPDHPLTAEVLMDYARFLKPQRKKEAASLQRRAAVILSMRNNSASGVYPLN